MAGTFPCNALLNKWRIRPDSLCTLCGQESETQVHVQCLCPALQGARIRAHHNIAKRLWHGIQTFGKKEWKMHEELTAQCLRSLDPPSGHYDLWHRMCDDLIPNDNDDPLEQEEDDTNEGGGLGRKRPDAWAIRWDTNTVYILEFTRPYDSQQNWETATDRYKQNKYLPVKNRIRQSLPAWTVEILTFTMGVRGSYNEVNWETNLSLFGISKPDQGRLMTNLVAVCLDELIEIYQTRNASVAQRQIGTT